MSLILTKLLFLKRFWNNSVVTRSTGFFQKQKQKMADELRAQWYIALKIGDIQALEQFCAANKTMDINMVIDLHGNTGLHFASANDNIDLVKFLCQKGATINCLNNNGDTPLMSATWRNALQAMNFLAMELDADVQITNKQGETALKLAKFDDARRIILSAMAKHYSSSEEDYAPENEDDD